MWARSTTSGATAGFAGRSPAITTFRGTILTFRSSMSIWKATAALSCAITSSMGSRWKRMTPSASSAPCQSLGLRGASRRDQRSWRSGDKAPRRADPSFCLERLAQTQLCEAPLAGDSWGTNGSATVLRYRRRRVRPWAPAAAWGPPPHKGLSVSPLRGTNAPPKKAVDSDLSQLYPDKFLDNGIYYKRPSQCRFRHSERRRISEMSACHFPEWCKAACKNQHTLSRIVDKDHYDLVCISCVAARSLFLTPPMEMARTLTQAKRIKR